MVENYTEWIQQVATLTINSLNSWQWASSSVYYLLGVCVWGGGMRHDYYYAAQ